MSEYYTIIVAIAMLSMFSMLVCVSTSGTLSRSKKNYFRLLFISVAVAAFCEWSGIYLQGTGITTQVLHIAVKAIELSIAPAIGFLIAAVIEAKFKKTIIILLVVQAIAEVLSGVFGFIYKVDANSVYTHEKFYWIYTATYAVSILYGVYIIVRNMKKYQYNGVSFFCMITGSLLFGIIVQICNSELKVVYMAVAAASIMLYVFTLEMIQQNDGLTGLINRRGYENYTAHIEDNSVVLMFDIDRFKNVNDEYGHHAGDVCLMTVGNALRNTYAKYGKCFRIGGDEFCVILSKKIGQIEEINKAFYARIKEQQEKDSRMPFVSIGYVFFNPQADSIQDALSEADRNMYQCKEQHRSLHQAEV